MSAATPMLIKVVPRGCVSLIWAGVSIVFFRTGTQVEGAAYAQVDWFEPFRTRDVPAGAHGHPGI
jgi:hypothetical protein